MQQYHQEQMQNLTIKWCDDNNFELVLFETKSHKGSIRYIIQMYLCMLVKKLLVFVLMLYFQSIGIWLRGKFPRYHDVFEISERSDIRFLWK
jgi:hypothetical protein